MGLEYSKPQKPLTAEDVKRMQDTMAVNKAKDQAAAYDIAFENFKYFAIENFNNYLKEAVKAESTKFDSYISLLDSRINKHLRNKELDIDLLYRCANYLANTYPDFVITYDFDDATMKIKYHVDISPKLPTRATETDHLPDSVNL